MKNAPFEIRGWRLLLLILLGVGISLSLVHALAFIGGKKSLLLLYAAPGLMALTLIALTMLRQPLHTAIMVFPILYLTSQEYLIVPAALGIVMLALITNVVQGGKYRSPDIKEYGLFSVLLLLGAYAFLRSQHELRVMMFLGQFVAPFGMYLAISSMKADREYFIRVLKTLLIVYAIIGVGSIISKVIDPAAERVAGFPSMSVTMFGYTAAALVPLAMEFVHREQNKRFWQIVLLLHFILVLLTNSRMAFGIVLVGIVLQMRRIRNSTWVFGLMGLGIIGLGAELLFTRFTASEGMMDISTAARLMAYQGCVRLIAAHPWFGVGLGNFTLLYTKFTLMPLSHLHHAHNFFLNKAVSIGIPGMILYLGAVFGKTVGGFKMRGLSLRAFFQGSFSSDPLLYATTVALSTYLMVGLIDSIFFYGKWVVWFWLLLAIHQRLRSDCVETTVSNTTADGEK